MDKAPQQLSEGIGNFFHGLAAELFYQLLVSFSHQTKFLPMPFFMATYYTFIMNEAVNLNTRLLDKYNAVGNPYHTMELHKALPNEYKKYVLQPFLNEVLKRTRHPTILDVASGDGQTEEYITKNSPCRVIQTDISLSSLSASKGNRVQALAQALPFAESSIDGIHMKDAIVHIDATNELFDQFYRILKPGGRVLLTTALGKNKSSFSFRLKGLPLTLFFPIKSIDQYINAAGLLTNLGIAQYINPPYFIRQPEEYIESAKKSGFIISKPQVIKTTKFNEDWYGAGVSRLVLNLYKPRPTLEFQSLHEAANIK